MSSAILPLYHPFRLRRLGCAQESSMDQVITMLAHRQTQVMQNRCVPCMVERRRIHLDRIHHDMTHCPMDYPLEGQVAMLLLVPDGKADPVKGFRLSRTDHQTAYQRALKFASSRAPKLTRKTLVNTDVHHFIQYIHQLLHQEAFDYSVLSNLIDSETVLSNRPKSYH